MDELTNFKCIRFEKGAPPKVMAAELARALGIPVGSLERLYPSLRVTPASFRELDKLYDRQFTANAYVPLIDAKDCLNILDGRDAEYVYNPMATVLIGPNQANPADPQLYTIQPRNEHGTPANLGPGERTAASQLFSYNDNYQLSVVDLSRDEPNSSSTAASAKLNSEDPKDPKDAKQVARPARPRPFNPLASSFMAQADPARLAEQYQEEIVSIAIDIDEAGYKVKENILWNLYETQVSLRSFAELLCNDLNLPAALIDPIESIMQSQIDDYSECAGDLYKRNLLNYTHLSNFSFPPSYFQWGGHHHHQHSVPYNLTNTLQHQQQGEPGMNNDTQAALLAGATDKKIVVAATAETVNPPEAGPSTLLLIDISIIVGGYKFTDRFEWDVQNEANCPIRFSLALCQDMNLSNEYANEIAYTIYEQIYFFKKAILESSYQPSTLQDVGNNILRKDLDACWAPALKPSTQADIENYNRTRERILRRLKRNKIKIIGGEYGASRRLKASRRY